MATPEEFKGAMDFCSFLRGKVPPIELMDAWEKYKDAILTEWKFKEVA